MVQIELITVDNCEECLWLKTPEYPILMADDAFFKADALGMILMNKTLY